MMKKYFIFLLAIISCLCISCEKSKDNYGSDYLAGNWEIVYYHEYEVENGVEYDPHNDCEYWYPGLDEEEFQVLLDIKNNGSVTLTSVEKNGHAELFRGTWEIISDKYVTFDIENTWWFEYNELYEITKKSCKEIVLSCYYDDGYIVDFILKKR